jgi:hypothetical protein
MCLRWEPGDKEAQLAAVEVLDGDHEGQRSIIIIHPLLGLLTEAA